MSANNDITGDAIRTRPASDGYRDNYGGIDFSAHRKPVPSADTDHIGESNEMVPRVRELAQVYCAEFHEGPGLVKYHVDNFIAWLEKQTESAA